jgi:hypothetical protein
LLSEPGASCCPALADHLAEPRSFHMILLPSNISHSYRLITIGKKQLPQRSKSKERRQDIEWGKVLDISDDLSTLKERLGPRKYMTKTRGEFCRATGAEAELKVNAEQVSVTSPLLESPVAGGTSFTPPKPRVVPRRART